MPGSNSSPANPPPVPSLEDPAVRDAGRGPPTVAAAGGVGRTWWLPAIFAAALAAHFHLATFNWRAGFLPGHEFRQTHTALIAQYIDEENNFSPRYSVPIFGKPWSVPMEYPLYEWSVVGLSRLTGVPHHVAARTVTLLCF